jgi:2-keto-3-deoxy-L-rhamnonate aldolase RhmA
MDGKELQAIWRSGTPSFGAWVTISDAAAAAVICNSGYEWLIIDAEHHPFNPEKIREIVSVVRARKGVPIVRVPVNNPAVIKQMLDFGAEGVVVPLLHTAADAQEAVAACRYPPQGIRGYNPVNASNFLKDIDQYRKTINDRVLVILQVEHIDAVNNLDGILATPGISGILIGPADLSYSIGYPLQLGHPQVQAAIQTTISKCNVAGIPVGVAISGTPEELASLIRGGLNFMLIGFDYEWIALASKAMLNQMRSLTGGR